MSSKQLEAINLEAFSDEELNTLEKRITKERKRRDKTRVKEAQEEIRLVAAKYGIKPEDALAGTNGQHRHRNQGKISPKFRHPQDPSKTWTGRGRTPRWVQEWEQAGGTRDELRI